MRKLTTGVYLTVLAATLALLGWAVWILVNGLSTGGFPLADWKTHRPGAFVLVWLTMALFVLAPCYLLVIGSCLHALFTLARAPRAPAVSCLVGAAQGVLVVLLTFGVRIAVTAWFPEELHPPFAETHGNPALGFAATLAVLGLAVLVFNVMARIPPLRQRARASR